jgi:hypothetical protein
MEPYPVGMKRRKPSAAWAARRIAFLEQEIRRLEQHVIGESWHRRTDRLALADRYRQQAFRLGRYLPREPESCNLPF